MEFAKTLIRSYDNIAAHKRDFSLRPVRTKLACANDELDMIWARMSSGKNQIKPCPARNFITMSLEPRFLVEDPQSPTPSESARSAARIRSKSSDEGPRRPPLLGEWDPASWQAKPITQDVLYDDAERLERALTKLETLPPLVSANEIESLRDQLAQAARGERFILQGGDCAELFNYCNPTRIDGQLKVLLQMSLVLIWALQVPITRIGRMAGQYAKPRSKLTEIVDGKEIPSFRGDNINGYDVRDRVPNPDRLVEAYFHSAATLNYVRASLDAGFADLHHPRAWDLTHVRADSTRRRYEEIRAQITENLKFVETLGATGSGELSRVDIFTSHEALMLEFEQSLTRRDPRSGKWYDTSAHFIWIGDRTRQIDGAHVEFFRGVQNPIGIKVGPTMEVTELVRLLDIVDPQRQDGRVTLITRYGADKIAAKLPAQIRAVQKSGHRVVWISDPCHGNTKTSPLTKLKTRYVDDIMSEITQALEIHKANGSKLNGVHLELTGDAVTECIGGSQNLEDGELVLRYDTVCDPRLSLSQSLDVAFLVADHLKQ